jgi:hypothetical protein
MAPSSWAESGSKVSLQVFVSLPSRFALALRDQLIGYVENRDEQIVPVLSATPGASGFYKFLGCQIDTDPTAVALGTFEAAIDLEKVQDFTQPMLESIISGALMTNVVGGLTADAVPFHAVPHVATEYNAAAATLGIRTSARFGDEGRIDVYDNNAAFSGLARFALSPSNFYVGSARFETQRPEPGSSFVPLVGLNTPQPSANWRLSNSLVRLVPVPAGGSNSFGTGGVWNLSFYNGTSWSTPLQFKIGSGSVGGFGNYTAVKLLRNSVEEAAIRLSCPANGMGDPQLATIDLSLRRGDRLVRGRLKCTAAIPWYITGGSAGSPVTFGGVTSGGASKTVDDADGNRYAVFSYQKATTQGATGFGGVGPYGITLSAAATTFDFAMGTVIGGGSATTGDAAVDLGAQYLGALGESQRVVPR